MARSCSACGTAVPTGARWCGACGHALGRSATPSEAPTEPRRDPSARRGARIRGSAAGAAVLAGGVLVAAAVLLLRSPGVEQATVVPPTAAPAPTTPAPPSPEDDPTPEDRAVPAVPSDPAEPAPEPSLQPPPTCTRGEDGPEVVCITWTRELPPAIDRSPYVTTGDLLVAGGTTGELVGVDLRTGAERWRNEIRARAIAPVSTSGGVVAVVLGDRRVMGIATDTGRVRWTDLEAQTSDRVPRVLGIGPWTAVDDGRSLRLLAFGTGYVHWRRPLTAGESTVLDPAAMFVVRDDRITALDTGLGTERWTATLPTRIVPRAAVQDGLVLVPGRDGRVRALELGDGTAVWTSDLVVGDAALAVTSASRDLARLIVRVYGGPIFGRLWNLTVVDASSGGALLRDVIPSLRDPMEASALVGDVLVVSTTAPDGSGELVAYDVPSGEPRWSRPVGGARSLDVVGDDILLAGRDGLRSIDLATGELGWTLHVPDPEVVSLDPLVVLLRNHLVAITPP